MDLHVPEGASVVAVLLHPHPDMGGDRFNHVISALYQRLPDAGVGVARFDFSSSDLDRAAAEAVAAIDEVDASGSGAAIVLVGYSFGALVAMRVTDPRVAGWFLVALPIDHAQDSSLPDDPRPKAIAVPEHDFSPPARVAEVTPTWTATEVHVVPDADHFLAGATAAVVDHVAAWARSLPGV